MTFTDEPPRKESLVQPRKHWLEYAIFAFVILTTIATSWAAYYTQRQAETVRDQERRQLRAYLGTAPGAIDVDKTEKSSGYIGAIIKVRNFGQAPAYDVKPLKHGYKLSPPLRGELESIDGGTQVSVEQKSKYTLFPSVEVPIGHVQLTSTSENKQIASGSDYSLIVFGTISYRDVFDEVHVTNYCYIYSRERLSDGAHCHMHNDSD